MVEQFVICHNFITVGYVARSIEEPYKGMYYSEDQTLKEEENEEWTDDITKAKIFKEKTGDFDVECHDMISGSDIITHHDGVEWLPIVEDAE